jgi:ribonucleoside-diphosphate reductase alpha chain
MHPEIKISKEDGSLKSPWMWVALKTVIGEACEGLTDVDGEVVLTETLEKSV